LVKFYSIPSSFLLEIIFIISLGDSLFFLLHKILYTIFVTPKGLQGSFDVYTKMIDVLENNFYFKTTTIGEPQLGKRGLYPSITTNHTDYSEAFLFRNVLAYADGTNDLIDIANIINVSAYALIPVITKLKKHGLIK